jgi:energy-coupling factor transport system ATP-binding protein
MDLRVEGLVHEFPEGIRALDGVDLAVPAGTRVAVVGANGSGKSTLLRHLDGLLRPTAGRVLVGGEDAAGLRVAELARRVGLCFADPDRQVFAASVRAEVAFGPRQLGRTAAELERAVGWALELTGLADVAPANPGELGPSRRKLLALAAVLSMETPVVALDEPTTGLDAPGVARVAGAVAALGHLGRTVVVVSHDMRFVAEACDRVVVLREGRVALQGDLAVVFGEPSWPLLREAGLEPPAAAVLGARLGLGPTPTDASLVAALAAGTSASTPRDGVAVPAPDRHPAAT